MFQAPLSLPDSLAARPPEPVSDLTKTLDSYEDCVWRGVWSDLARYYYTGRKWEEKEKILSKPETSFGQKKTTVPALSKSVVESSIKPEKLNGGWYQEIESASSELNIF